MSDLLNLSASALDCPFFLICSASISELWICCLKSGFCTGMFDFLGHCLYWCLIHMCSLLNFLPQCLHVFCLSVFIVVIGKMCLSMIFDYLVCIYWYDMVVYLGYKNFAKSEELHTLCRCS